MTETATTAFGYLWAALAVFQCFYAPFKASATGKDGAAWFLLTLFWMILVGWVAMFSGIAMVVAASSGRDPMYQSAVILLFVVLAILVTFAPSIALMFGSTPRPRYRSRVGRHARRRR